MQLKPQLKITKKNMISLTEIAASKITSHLLKRKTSIGLRLGVKTTGCSGLAYVLEYADKLEESDIVYEDRGVKLIIDPKSLVYLTGLVVDYKRTGLNEGFEFSNPNERDRCGCGESFRV
jgi:iron-sulfur cluster assembly protein